MEFKDLGSDPESHDLLGLMDQYLPMSAELGNAIGDISMDFSELGNFNVDDFLKSLDMEEFGKGIDLFICPIYLSNILFCLRHRPHFDQLHWLPI